MAKRRPIDPAVIRTAGPAAAEEERNFSQFDAAIETQSITEETNGDVTFWAIAVDTRKQPNARHFVFAWKSAADVMLQRIESNGVLLYMHDRWSLPVGRIERAKVTKTQVLFFCRIPGGEGFEDLQWLRTWVSNGYLKAVSIGFIIYESEEIEDKGVSITIVKRFEILELSLVTIGAHATALIKQAADGIEATSLRTGSELPDGWCDAQAEEGADMDKEGEPEAQDTAPALEVWVHQGPCQQETVAEAQASTWSAAAMRKTAPTAAVLRAATVIPAGDEPDAGECKLLHHTADGTVSRRGVKECLGILLGARGGIPNLPEVTREAAFEHLRAHMVGMQLETPDIDTEETAEALAALGLVAIPGADVVLQPLERIEQLEDKVATLQAGAVLLVTEETVEPQSAVDPAQDAPDPQDGLTAQERASVETLLRLLVHSPEAVAARTEMVEQVLKELRQRPGDKRRR